MWWHTYTYFCILLSYLLWTLQVRVETDGEQYDWEESWVLKQDKMLAVLPPPLHRWCLLCLELISQESTAADYYRTNTVLAAPSALKWKKCPSLEWNSTRTRSLYLQPLGFSLSWEEGYQSPWQRWRIELNKKGPFPRIQGMSGILWIYLWLSAHALV